MFTQYVFESHMMNEYNTFVIMISRHMFSQHTFESQMMNENTTFVILSQYD